MIFSKHFYLFSGFLFFSQKLAFVDGDNKKLKKAYKVTKLPFLLMLSYNAISEYE